MDCFGISAFSVEVNEGTYILVLEALVSGDIVHSEIKAHILYREGRHMFFQFKERNGFMALCVGEAEEQWDIRMQHRGVAGKLE